MTALGADDGGDLAEVGRGLIDVRWADPDAVPEAYVAVEREEPGHRSAGMFGVAAVAAVLWLVAEHGPVRLWIAQFRKSSCEGVNAPADEGCEPLGDDARRIPPDCSRRVTWTQS
ncbi:hypothetical protein B6R96_12065 [Streptomyces sp. Sge12]|nr:hypothetical protein B6R96_12065 [Streptomyces sp. Sge12]